MIQRIKNLLGIGAPTKEHSIGDLEFIFKDQDGHKYYRFPTTVKFPLERHAKRADIATWMSAGLTSTELHKLVAVAIDELENMAAQKKGSLINASAALHQILLRSNMVLHHELMYQWFAVHYVRQDEPLYTVSDSIMDEKIEAFRKMVAGGRLLDFFQLPEVMNIANTIGMSKDEFQQSWKDSQTEMKVLNRKIEYLTSVLKSPKKEKISTIPL